MAFDFPAAPTNGTVHTEGGVDYVWDDTSGVWNLQGGGAMTDYVLKAGDAMTGALIAPSVEIQAAGQTDSGVRLFPAAGPNAGRIDFQTADGAARKGYVGYGGDTDLVLHAETGVKWRANGGFNVSGGNVICTTGNNVGFFLGDTWHGMYFHGNNTLAFTEYHNRFEWRHQNSGAFPGGTVQMSLYGGDLNIIGDLNVGGTIDNNGQMAYLGHIQSSSHIEAVQNVYALSFVVNTRSATGEVIDQMDLGEALKEALAEIKTLKAEVATLKAGR